MLSKTIGKLNFEISEIDKLLSSYELLINKCINEQPDLIEITAMATVLHSFYNGIEKIFLTIAKEIDNNVPIESKWHKLLLTQMLKQNDNRNWNISKELMDDLEEYLAFRHFYRHAYSFQLNWNKLSQISENIVSVWEKVKNEINELIYNLSK